MAHHSKVLEKKNNLVTLTAIQPGGRFGTLDINDENNINLINRLKEFGVNMDYISGVENNHELISGKIFVLTGSLTTLTRDEATSEIEKLGGTVTNSVSKKTNVLVVGENPGSKYDKALKLGIRIYTEEDIDSLIN